jgi:hypothetical protein
MESLRVPVRREYGMSAAKGTRIVTPRANVDTSQITQLRAQGFSWKKITKQMGLGVGTLYHVAPAIKPTY